MNTFTDPRDGEVYKTVKIGNQIWLAENLRYRGPVKKIDGWTIEEKYFYYPPDMRPSNIKEYGCLYTWETALKACPDGWRLPTKDEFKALLTYVGSDISTRSQNLHATTWKSGADKYGFSALPAGYYYGGYYGHFGDYAFFWSATEVDCGSAYRLVLGSDYACVGNDLKGGAFSVRCIKDQGELE